MKKNILIIDDEQMVLDTFQDILEDFGYDITVALSGEEGIQKAKNRQPDLIFLDLHMPGMNGVETMYHLRELYADVPIFIVTAFYNAFTKTLKGASMMDVPFDVFHKPIGANALRDIVTSAFAED